MSSGRLGDMLRVGLVLLIVLAAVITLTWAFQRKLIYFPSDGVPAAAQLLPGAQEVTLHTEDGLALGSWYLRPSGKDRGVSVLVAPGNGGSRALRAPLA